MTNTNSANSNSIVTGGASEGVIKLRLDTNDIITKTELFLRGKKIVPYINEETQEQVLKVENIGSALMNEEGIQCVLLTLNQTVSSIGVQGNWKGQYFEQFIAEVDNNFSCDLWVNLHKWGVKLENYNVICNGMMNLLQEFASRIIDNKERESYGMSMKTSESVVQNNGRTNSLFGG